MSSELFFDVVPLAAKGRITMKPHQRALSIRILAPSEIRRRLYGFVGIHQNTSLHFNAPTAYSLVSHSVEIDYKKHLTFIEDTFHELKVEEPTKRRLYTNKPSIDYPFLVGF